MVTLGGTLEEKCSGMENEDNKQRFVSLSKDEVQKLSVKFVLKNTKKNANWAVKNSTKWRDYHNSNSEDQCPENLLEVVNLVLTVAYYLPSNNVVQIVCKCVLVETKIIHVR